MNKSFVEWIDYYENATKEDVIQDMMLDINSIKEKNQEIERLKEELKDLNRILCVWNSRELINKFNKEYDKEDLEKNPNREYVVIYPDAEEVYKRYYKQKAIIKEVREYIGSKEHYKDDFDTEIEKVYKILDKEKQDV